MCSQLTSNPWITATYQQQDECAFAVAITDFIALCGTIGGAHA